MIYLGFWGTGLYDNDTTEDVKSFCECQYWQGFDSQEVQEKAIAQFGEMLDTDEEPLLWLTLADVQWDFSDVINETKVKANSLIENNAFAENFENLTDRKKWISTLLELKNKLNKKPPMYDTQTDKVNLEHHNWKIGDVFAYRFESKYSKQNNMYKKYILFQVLSEEREDDFGYLYVKVQFFNKLFNDIPNNCCVKNLQILPMDEANRFLHENKVEQVPLRITAEMNLLSNKDFPKKLITFINNQPVANVYLHEFEVGDSYALYWDLFEEYICDICWGFWQNHSLKIRKGQLIIN